MRHGPRCAIGQCTVGFFGHASFWLALQVCDPPNSGSAPGLQDPEPEFWSKYRGWVARYRTCSNAPSGGRTMRRASYLVAVVAVTVLGCATVTSMFKSDAKVRF